MKAVVYERYGPPDNLEYKEMDKPVPKADEVLVRIHAASLNALDWRMLRAEPFFIRFMGGGLLKPKNNILGVDIAGIVESVGVNVRSFKKGDAVYGDTSGGRMGGFAEYTCATEKALAIKPDSISFEDAAGVPMAGVTALQGLRDNGKIEPGKKVIINGASGGVGTFAVQIAKAFDTEVTAVCSTKNIERMLSLGADHVIDYTQENFTKNGKRYDLIFAVNGYHPISAYKRALTPNGVYVMAGGTGAQMAQAMVFGPLLSLFNTKELGGLMARPNREDLNFMAQWLESGKVKPVIDRYYRLSEVPDALRYLEEGHARGKVVIIVEKK